MSRRPWMPLYVADYLADTAHLNATQSGAYLALIMHYWLKGCLPSDEAMLKRITKQTDAEWEANRDVLASFFTEGWKHERVEAEMARAVDKHEKRAEAGRKGGLAKKLAAPAAPLLLEDCSSNAKAKSNHSDSHSDSQKEAPSEPIEGSSEPSHPSPRPGKPRKARPKAGDVPEGFDEFWQVYPRKVDKQPAIKAYRTKLRAGVKPADILAGAKVWAAQVAGKDPEFIKHASTWLNAHKWEELQPAPPEPPRAPIPPRKELTDEEIVALARKSQTRSMNDAEAMAGEHQAPDAAGAPEGQIKFH